MNDDLQKALSEILNKTTQGMEAGVSFLQRELPDVVQQILIWHGVKSAIYFFICICSIAGFVILTKKVFFWGKEESMGAEAFCVFPAIGVAASVFSAAMNITWLQIVLAPKLYLIEYAASLVK